MNNTTTTTNTTTTLRIYFGHTVASDAYLIVREAGFACGATSASMIHGSHEMTFFLCASLNLDRVRETIEEALQLWLEGRIRDSRDAAAWARNVMAVWA